MSITSDPIPVQTLGYAQATVKTGTRTWAGVALGFFALGLIFLGGCFLIGIMMTTMPLVLGNATATPPPSVGLYLFVAVLYLKAFVCFTTAGWLLFLSVGGLVRIMSAVV